MGVLVRIFLMVPGHFARMKAFSCPMYSPVSGNILGMICIMMGDFSSIKNYTIILQKMSTVCSRGSDAVLRGGGHLHEVCRGQIFSGTGFAASVTIGVHVVQVMCTICLVFGSFPPLRTANLAEFI